jgi:hypothetical protein
MSRWRVVSKRYGIEQYRYRTFELYRSRGSDRAGRSSDLTTHTIMLACAYVFQQSGKEESGRNSSMVNRASGYLLAPHKIETHE